MIENEKMMRHAVVQMLKLRRDGRCSRTISADTVFDYGYSNLQSIFSIFSTLNQNSRRRWRLRREGTSDLTRVLISAGLYPTCKPVLAIQAPRASPAYTEQTRTREKHALHR